MPREITNVLVRQEPVREYAKKIRAVRFATYAIVKRVLDFVFSVVLLVALLPLFLIVGILIKIDSPGPVFFKQERTGKDGRVFKMFKFRSMVADNDVRDNSCEDKYTRIGGFLRKTSIDELPQLFNVLCGQMSFIGPRPWITEYWTNMNEEERRRNLVRPGITGLAAAKGRNGLTIFEKIALDLEYVENFSLWEDLRVVFWTVKAVVGAKDVSNGKSGIHGDIDLLKERNGGFARTGWARKPLVSIIIPVFNGEKVILETINSIWQQTYKNWEAIIVDDVSTDGTRELLKKVKSRKIRVIKLRKNGGAAKARNRGIQEAKGDFICFLDADDLWHPEKLEKQVRFMLDNESSFSFTGYEFADENGIGNGRVVYVPETITYKQALKNTTISTITVMFNLNKLDKKDIKMPNIESEDTATWWNVLKNVEYANGLNEPLSLYRRTKNTLSSNKLVAIGRIWRLYRNHENLSLLSSVTNFVGYAYNAVKRRV
ncbi:sugar transferase [Candidatus Saccharibacteria bacterium]|nr:sugar transferase [Candidatus Saccharibacteria bacterium]